MTAAQRSEAGRAGIFTRFLDALGLELPANAFDRNNAVFVFLMGALPAVAGSATSFLLAIFSVLSLISLLFGRLASTLTPTDRVIALIFTGFAALVLATGLAGEYPLGVFRQSAWLLPFLSLWVVIPRLRASQGMDCLSIYIAGAAIGAVGAGIVSVTEVELAAIGERAAGGAGNPSVFALMSLLLAAIGALNVTSPRPVLRWLAVLGLLGGLVGMALSLTRGTWVAALPALAILLVYAPRQWLRMATRPAAWIGLAVFCLLLAWNSELLLVRVQNLDRTLDFLVSDGLDHSQVDERFRLWAAGLLAFADSPLWGHGIQNRMLVLVQYYPPDNVGFRLFSHVHNGFLSAALDGGLIVLTALVAVLAAPLVIAWQAPRDARFGRRLCLALLLVAIYAVNGQTQIIFKHDLHDSFFVFAAIVIAASIPAAGRKEEADEEAPTNPRTQPEADRSPAGEAHRTGRRDSTSGPNQGKG